MPQEKRKKEKTSLRFVTWNTNGIRSPDEKFSNVLRSLSKLQADIVFIQETRVGPNSYHILEDVKDWKVYFTVHSPKSKGVAILIKNSVPFEYICHDEDCSGGYIVLFCHLYGELHTLVNVYNHKTDKLVLGRLKEYLMETAVGVLVVGGDFNTVLHPSFDRSPSTSRHSNLRHILEDFTDSLNLRDIWSYKYSAKEIFTRQQINKYSRLDMFFMHNDTVGRACEITVENNEISDHNPVVLELEMQKQTGKKIQKGPSLNESNNSNPNMISGKISGAEILSAIKTLADFEEKRPDQKQVEDYKKKDPFQVTEMLKIEYNNMLKTNHVSKDFKESKNLSGVRHIFNVKYLIFCQILAKRLRLFITPSFKVKIATKLDILLKVTFETEPQKIKWSYLQTRFQYLKFKQISSAPPVTFRILQSLLPKCQSTSGEFICLQPGCPLTNIILNLALKHLESLVSLYKWNCEVDEHKNGKRHKAGCKQFRSMASICYQRQVLLIHTQSTRYKNVLRRVKHFTRISGLKISRDEC